VTPPQSRRTSTCLANACLPPPQILRFSNAILGRLCAYARSHDYGRAYACWARAWTSPDAPNSAGNPRTGILTIHQCNRRHAHADGAGRTAPPHEHHRLLPITFYHTAVHYLRYPTSRTAPLLHYTVTGWVLVHCTRILRTGGWFSVIASTTFLLSNGFCHLLLAGSEQASYIV